MIEIAAALIAFAALCATWCGLPAAPPAEPAAPLTEVMPHAA